MKVQSVTELGLGLGLWLGLGSTILKGYSNVLSIILKSQLYMLQHPDM